MTQDLHYSLSLSLSLAARDNNIIKKFHKTSKIKNRKIIDGRLEMSRSLLFLIAQQRKITIDILFSDFRVSCGHQKRHQTAKKIQSRGC